MVMVGTVVCVRISGRVHCEAGGQGGRVSHDIHGTAAHLV